MSKSYVEARAMHGQSELLDEIVAAKPKMEHTRYHSMEELKDAGLQHLRSAVALLESKATPEELDEVLATATSTADLQATTPLFGVPGTTYSTNVDQGFEFDDSATKYVDQTGVNYTLNSWTASDAFRIITLAP